MTGSRLNLVVAGLAWFGWAVGVAMMAASGVGSGYFLVGLALAVANGVTLAGVLSGDPD